MDPRQLLSALTQIVQQLAAAGVHRKRLWPRYRVVGNRPCHSLEWVDRLQWVDHKDQCQCQGHRGHPQCHRAAECPQVFLVECDNNRVSADQGRFNSKWRRLFRDTSRRWRMLRLSNKAITHHRHTFRCSDAIGHNILRPHLFGVVE